MKIISYNLNGIRSALGKGLIDYLKEAQADVVCFQELKAQEDQIDLAAFEDLDYYCNWFAAQKKGYSGVAILSKEKPAQVVHGCKHEMYDAEGRFLRVDLKELSVVSAYFPSGTTGDIRQNIKMEFLDYMDHYVSQLLIEKPNLVLCGDYNIANEDIDIHNPKSNQKTSGFLPEEREWLRNFWLKHELSDSFRLLNPEEVKYSWWSFRAGARKNNKGWRIDYQAVSNPLVNKLNQAYIDNSAVHSDHCPIGVVLG